MSQLQYKTGAFEGPLDMLLYLIAKHKMDIFDICIYDLLDQYLKQIEILKEQNLEITGEFLEMTARLIHIKTVMLLPKHEDDADRLKQELTGQLIEYSICKKTAQILSDMNNGYSLFSRPMMKIEFDESYKGNENKDDLVQAYLLATGKKMRRLPPSPSVFTPIVTRRIVSVRSRILHIVRSLLLDKSINLSALYESSEDKPELIATFLAVLELAKSKDIIIEGNDIRKINAGGDINWNLESSDLQ